MIKQAAWLLGWPLRAIFVALIEVARFILGMFDQQVFAEDEDTLKYKAWQRRILLELPE